MSWVVLVTKQNRKIGIKEKMAAHREGALHRAISVFVFNDKNQLLLQQRAKSKYHSGSLWSNTSCTHPKPNEHFSHAAHRRLCEELHFDCSLQRAYCFIYWAKLNRGMNEHEYDCVFLGRYNGTFKANPREIMRTKWVGMDELRRQIRNHPSRYSVWLKIILKDPVFTAALARLRRSGG